MRHFAVRPGRFDSASACLLRLIGDHARHLPRALHGRRRALPDRACLLLGHPPRRIRRRRRALPDGVRLLLRHPPRCVRCCRRALPHRLRLPFGHPPGRIGACLGGPVGACLGSSGGSIALLTASCLALLLLPIGIPASILLRPGLLPALLLRRSGVLKFLALFGRQLSGDLVDFVFAQRLLESRPDLFLLLPKMAFDDTLELAELLQEGLVVFGHSVEFAERPVDIVGLALRGNEILRFRMPFQDRIENLLDRSGVRLQLRLELAEKTLPRLYRAFGRIRQFFEQAVRSCVIALEELPDIHDRLSFLRLFLGKRRTAWGDSFGWFLRIHPAGCSRN
ncbi:MAG TPA: hypothetical protein VGD08_26905 [Stellaceae bacterium]